MYCQFARDKQQAVGTRSLFQPHGGVVVVGRMGVRANMLCCWLLCCESRCRASSLDGIERLFVARLSLPQNPRQAGTREQKRNAYIRGTSALFMGPKTMPFLSGSRKQQLLEALCHTKAPRAKNFELSKAHLSSPHSLFGVSLFCCLCYG